MLLTEAGRTFLKEARSILSQSQRAVQLAQAASRGEAGHLDIAYSVEGFEPVLLRVIRLFFRWWNWESENCNTTSKFMN
jgi:DNA-binding transcriptional LysR family regulator